MLILCCKETKHIHCSTAQHISTDSCSIQGTSVDLRVQQDASQILFSSVPAQRQPRHAFAARWHFDMVQDQLRNDAYAKAITRVS